MSLLADIIMQEKQRIVLMMADYEQQLEALPKGVLSEKKVKNNSYYYLQYREGKKVVSCYIGKNEVKLNEIRSLLERRKHIKTMLQSLQDECALAMKVTERSL